MLDRGISMSHRVCLFDVDASNDNFTHMGIFRVGPIVLKPTAYVFYNLNKINDALKRLPLSINQEMYALAGKNDSNDKIVVIFPADEPQFGNNTINLTIINLPWGNSGYLLKRYELTELSYLNNIIHNLTFSSTSQNDFVSDSFQYSSVNGSGRLVIWEITPLESTFINENSFLSIPDFKIYPNPNQGNFYIETKDKSDIILNIKITNLTGQIVYEYNFENPHYKQNLETNLPTGFYNILLNTNKGFYSTKMIVSKQK